MRAPGVHAVLPPLSRGSEPEGCPRPSISPNKTSAVDITLSVPAISSTQVSTLPVVVDDSAQLGVLAYARGRGMRSPGVVSPVGRVDHHLSARLEAGAGMPAPLSCGTVSSGFVSDRADCWKIRNLSRMVWPTRLWPQVLMPR
jgi:hypothetical protein